MTLGCVRRDLGIESHYFAGDGLAGAELVAGENNATGANSEDTGEAITALSGGQKLRAIHEGVDRLGWGNHDQTTELFDKQG
jgi:hypothetical protein